MPVDTTTTTTIMSPHRKQRKRRRHRTLGTIQTLLTTTTIMILIIVIGRQPEPISCSASQELETNSSISTLATTTTTTTTTTPTSETTIIINNNKGRIPSTRQEGEATKLDKAREQRQQQHQKTRGIDKQTEEEKKRENGEGETKAANKSIARQAQLSKRAAPLAPQSQQQQQLQFLQQLRVSESDLLPFSDFNVQQPAFSDIMKSWPPTTRRQTGPASDGGAAQHAGARTGSHAGARANTRAQGGLLRPAIGADILDEQAPPARNHLNEDYDDTIVTADESFEQDQLPEPPTWVNYLGELGDFIYSQLLSFFESSSRSPFSIGEPPPPPPPPPPAQTQNSAATKPPGRSSSGGGGGGGTPVEIIDELVDDFYYDQYENSQVLYYGPQLVREGDIFEIGCYLPNDQPAEWTKSGKSLVRVGGGNQSAQEEGNGNGDRDRDHHQQLLASGDAGGSSSMSPSLRLIKSGNFLGAKRNYSLKVFEAQPSDSGNYRCNRLSRKYHKLVVVPARMPPSQLYLVQQRLLSVVGSSLSTSSSNSNSNSDQSQDQLQASAHETTLSQQQIQLATLYYQQQQQQQQAGWSASGQKFAQQQRQQQQKAGGRTRQPLTIQASGTSGGGGGAGEGAYYSSAQNAQTAGPRYASATANGTNKWPVSTSSNFLVQGHLIREQQQLSVTCHITDERVLSKLHELGAHFQLAWYKNGKLLRASQSSANNNNNNNASRQTSRFRAGLAQDTQTQTAGISMAARGPSTQRIQFVGRNGRQMLISSASFSDAGDYLCSWAKLAALVRQSSQGGGAGAGGGRDEEGDSESSAPGQGDGYSPQGTGATGQADFSSASVNQQPQQLPVNPLSAASHHQLVAPVKLRPFKSAYHVRQHDQLRLFCQVQRGYPAAQISWYVGNQLVDADYLREHPGEFRILQLQASGGPRGLSVLTSPQSSGGNGADDAVQQNQQPTNEQQAAAASPMPQIVEINPVPAGRQQMALTANGRGQWVNHADLTNERYAIDTPDRQLRYLQMKLGQLTGASELLVAAAAAASDTTAPAVQLPQQAGLSMLVVNKLDKERHTSRYACRATTRANTDEVTTVIRVKDSATVVMRPYGSSATLVPGQPLHFECQKVYDKRAQFIWYKRSVVVDEAKGPPTLTLLDPAMDDTIEIHNERLTLHKPTYASIGDYICRALNEDKTESEKEFQTIRVRAPPYVSDFGIETSHTGKSATIAEGERLELLCRVPDESVPVNITWLMSVIPDSDKRMQPISEEDPTPAESESQESQNSRGRGGPSSEGDVPSYQAMQNVYVERVDRFAKKLVIREVGEQHRGHYACMVDNGVTERTRKFIYIRVKDRIVALWPFLGILAELFILFTIIYVWETQRAQKTLNAKSVPMVVGGGRNLVPSTTPHSTSAKRAPSGPTNAFESVPLKG